MMVQEKLLHSTPVQSTLFLFRFYGAAFFFSQYFARQVSENSALENAISSMSVNANALSKLGFCLFMRATHRQWVVGGGLWVVLRRWFGGAGHLASHSCI